jgi:hypothetical protein
MQQTVNINVRNPLDQKVVEGIGDGMERLKNRGR